MDLNIPEDDPRRDRDPSEPVDAPAQQDPYNDPDSPERDEPVDEPDDAPSVGEPAWRDPDPGEPKQYVQEARP